MQILDFIAVGSDAIGLNFSKAPTQILLGEKRSLGLGMLSRTYPDCEWHLTTQGYPHWLLSSVVRSNADIVPTGFAMMKIRRENTIPRTISLAFLVKTISISKRRVAAWCLAAVNLCCKQIFSIFAYTHNER